MYQDTACVWIPNSPTLEKTRQQFQLWLKIGFFFHILLYFRFTLSAGLRSQLCCVGKVEKGFKNKNVYSAEFCFHAFLLTTKKLSTVAYLRLNNQRWCERSGPTRLKNDSPLTPTLTFHHTFKDLFTRYTCAVTRSLKQIFSLTLNS